MTLREAEILVLDLVAEGLITLDAAITLNHVGAAFMIYVEYRPQPISLPDWAERMMRETRAL